MRDADGPLLHGGESLEMAFLPFRTPSSRRGAKHWRTTLLGGSALALATAGWAFDEQVPMAADPAPATAGPTLNGILPEEVPFGLTTDDFGVLTGKWEEWGNSAATAVQNLFRPHESTEQLEADLAAVEIKLKTMRKALDDSRYKSLHGPLADLEGALRRRVDVAKVILAAQRADVSAVQGQALESSLAGLKSALSGLKSDLKRYGNGARWLPYVEADALQAMADTREVAPDVLTDVKERLAGRSTLADEAQRNFLHRDAFINLERAIDNLLAASVVKDQSGYVAKLQEIGAALFAAIEEYEQRPDETAAKAIREQYQAWRENAADGGEALSSVMRTHYMNYNMRVVASEEFLRRLYEERRQEMGRVNDTVMEARVCGTQCTNTLVTVDVKPSNDRAAFMLQLKGNVRSNTLGVTDQARVHTDGNHTFRAEKEIFFDGHNFSATNCRISVAVRNTTLDVDTNIRIPIIRGIANGIAYKEVEKRRPQTDALTRQKISQQVAPRLDREVGEQFNKASTQLEAKVYGPLRELESYPQALDTSSTDTALLIRARLMEDQELGGGQWPNVAMPTQGVVIQTHESLLNNAVERAGFAGREMTQQQVNDELKARLEKLLGRKFEEAKEETQELPPTPATAPEGDQTQPETVEEGAGEVKADENAVFVFDSHDAIRFDVTDGEVRLILRTGLKREGSDPIPTHIIEIPLGFTVEGDKIFVRRLGTPKVGPVERSGGRAEQIVRNNVMRANIQRLVPDRSFKSTMEIKQGNKNVKVSITDIVSRDGWVNVFAR